MAIKVAIIIINYNGTEDTLECLSSLNRYLKNEEDIRFEIALLDNHSKEPIPQTSIPTSGIPIHYYQSDDNLGFAGGNNLAIRNICKEVDKIDYYFLLNNDTVLVDNSLVRLVKKTVGSGYDITGLVNYYYDQPNECWQAGSFVRPAQLTGKEINPSKYQDCSFVEVDTVPGSSLLISTEVTNKIGLLDDNFFAYYEELDWCLRAKEKGYKVAFLSGTKILHKVGRSSTSLFKHYLRTRNTLLLYKKHYGELIAIARLRVFLRTISGIIRWDNIKLWEAYMAGVKDFKLGKYGKGTLSL